MKLWIGAETQADVVDLFRPVRKDVEGAINSAIGDFSHDIGVDSWDCIVILRDDCDFKEITKFNKAKRDMDFRLSLEYKQFVQADGIARRRLLIQLLLRSLLLLKEKVSAENEIGMLAEIVKVAGDSRGWL